MSTTAAQLITPDNPLNADVEAASTTAVRRASADNRYSDTEDNLESNNEGRPFISYQLLSRNKHKRHHLLRSCGCCRSLIAVVLILFIIIKIFTHVKDDTSPPKLPLPEKSHSNRLRDVMNNKAPYEEPIPGSVLNSLNGTCPSAELDPGRVPDKCQLVYLHLFVRHGTRNPSMKRIKLWNVLEKKLHSNVRSYWPEWLKEWKNPYNVAEGDQLVEQGRVDMRDLAYRDACRYKDSLKLQDSQLVDNGILSEYQLDARDHMSEYASTDLQRCVDSALAYASVFSGKNMTKADLSIKPAEYDYDLDILRTCPAWWKQWGDLSNVNILNKLSIKRYFPSILRKMSAYFGYPVTYKNYPDLLHLCLWEYSRDKHDTKWCDLLKSYRGEISGELPDDIPSEDTPGSYGKHPNVFELYDFIMDSSFYATSGLGAPNNDCYARKAMSHLLHNMQLAMDGNLKKPWQLGFSFANNMLLMLTFMGLYTEKPTFNQNREFRTSKLIPFASNLRFELFKCDRNDNDQKPSDHFIRILHNEHPIQLPGYYIQRRVARCSFKKVCDSL
ncbi:histidine phosphatase superfamily [Syncephalis fuscata]|nr:histidine phosphatase superfamily [Syncephalis fuscata]